MQGFVALHQHQLFPLSGFSANNPPGKPVSDAFVHNHAGQDIGMMNVRQKITGTFTGFCRGSGIFLWIPKGASR